MNFQFSGGQQIFTITSNTIKWTVSSSAPSWLTVSVSSGSGNGSITVTANPNTSPDPQTATITVEGTGFSTQTIQVKIAGAPQNLSVSPTLLSFSAVGEQRSFNITSNIDWTIVNNASWLTLSANKGSNNSTVSVTATENPGLTQRTATITVSGEDMPDQFVSVMQEAATSMLTLSTNMLDFPAVGEQRAVTITSNTNWIVGSNASWLTITPASGSDNGTLTVTAANNTSTTQRTATVTVSGIGVLPRTVNVTQAAYAPPSLSVSPVMLSFAAAGEQRTFNITSNVNWTVGSNASWLTITPASGSDNGTVTVVAAANTGVSSRTATITISGTGVTSRTVSVTQQATVAETFTLTVSTNILDFSEVGEQKIFTVASNTNWTVGSDAGWLIVSPTGGADNGTVTVTAAANTGASPRIATITVSGVGAPTRAVTVTQHAAASETPALHISTTTMDFSAVGEQQTFRITSNTYWDVGSDANWLTISPVSGANDGTVTVTAAANSDASPRTATVTISGTDVSSKTVSITQAGYSVTPSLSVSLSSLSFTASGEQKTFTISSNTNWTVGSSDTWLTVSPASGANNGTVTVTAAANTATTPRTATITVSGTGVTSQTISVTQEAAALPALTLSTSTLDFAATNEQKSFTITSNTSWTVVSNDTWLTVSPASGSNNGTVTVTVAANFITTSRTATITVTGTGVASQTITVTQSAAPLELSVSTTLLDFSAAGEQKSFTVTSNTGWTVGSSDTWVAVSPTSSANNGTVTVTAAANTATTPRTATISVSGTGVTSQTISVTQEASTIVQSWNLTPTMTATLDVDGVLTISTTANSEAMPNYSSAFFQAAPWKYYASSVLSVVIEDKVTTIGHYAFSDCRNFVSVTIPNSVTTIGYNAFEYCYSLVSVTIPNSVTTIGDEVFIWCTSLESVTIPNSVISIRSRSFDFCSNLKTVTVEWNRPPSMRFLGVPLSTATLRVPAGTLSEYQEAYEWKYFGTIVEY